MNHDDAIKLSQKTYFLMQCQERTGVAFDKTKAEELYNHCCSEMERIENEIEPQLPEKDLNKGELDAVTPPKVQLKNSKEGLIPSAHAEKFFEEFAKVDDGDWHGRWGEQWFKLPHNEPVTTKGKMQLKDQAALKDWFMEQGWTPTFWNYQKDSSGKFVRDGNKKLVKTSPKLHDKGVICPNLEKLGDTVELVKPIVEWMSLRNRRSVIWNPEKNSGWLANWRLEVDDRLGASSSGITNTHRQKHMVVANIPRTTSLLGEEMRSLFTVAEGNVMVGYDASGLESRVEAHWCYDKPGGKQYAEDLLHGDIHTKNAELFFGDAVEYGDDGKAIGKYRDPSKNGKYALTYGSQPPTLATTLNIPLNQAKELYENFWNGNTALATLKAKITKHWEGRGKNSIYCPLTGHILQSRSEHSLVNLLFQHTGAIIMDLAGAFMDAKLGGIVYKNDIPCYHYKGQIVKRVVYYHDEYQWECSPMLADEIGELGRQSIIKAGEFLKLNVPLDADYSIGKSWSETH